MSLYKEVFLRYFLIIWFKFKIFFVKGHTLWSKWFIQILLTLSFKRDLWESSNLLYETIFSSLRWSIWMSKFSQDFYKVSFSSFKTLFSFLGALIIEMWSCSILTHFNRPWDKYSFKNVRRYSNVTSPDSSFSYELSLTIR